MSRGVILLVEDHRDLAETVIDALEDGGFAVDYAANGLQALELASRQPFDAIILDVMLPGLDGMRVCGRLRNDFHIDTPVLMLTARDEMDDKLEGFGHGADDYLVKPFAMAELMARVAALVNRRRGRVSRTRLVCGEVVIDTRGRTVRHAGRKVSLSPTGYDILRILARESPNVVPRETLERELWGDDPPDSDALRSHIYLLRKAMAGPAGGGESPVKTVKGVGFRLA